MSSKIHGDIVKYRSLFPNSKENPSDMGDIQLATYEDKSKAVNVFRFLTQKNKKTRGYSYSFNFSRVESNNKRFSCSGKP